MASLVGRILGSGRYEILELYGKGAFAEVYRGRQINLNRDVAVKVLNETSSRDESLVKRFHQEAAAVARFDHPNIIKIFDHGQEGLVHYYVMNFLPRTLRSLLHPNRPLPVDIIFQIANQLAAALAYAQTVVNNFVHRDLKPENVMLDQSHNAVLSDFGLVRGDELARLTVGDNVIGTPTYMSPEQIRGKPLDPRSDLYALGVLLFECATGSPPFKGDLMSVCHQHVNVAPVSPRTLNPDLPPGLETLILKLLEKSPAHRYQTASEVLLALAEFPRQPSQPGLIYSQPTLPVSPRPATTPVSVPMEPPAAAAPAPARPASSSRRLWPTLSFVGIAAATLVIALLTFLRVPQPESRPPQPASEPTRPQAAVSRPAGLTARAGRLEVKSTPEGAMIEIDGISQKRRTPARFDSLPPGRYHVTLHLPGFQVWREVVTIEKGGTAILSAALTPAAERPVVTTVALRITSRPPSEIFLDGTSIGKPASGVITVPVAPGPHELQFRLAPHPAISRHLVVKAEKSQEFDIDLLGEISVQAFDEAGDPVFGAVFLNGHQVDWKPDGSRQHVLIGDYEVTVRSFGFVMAEPSKKVSVRGGEYQPIVIQMKRE
ncbi:MAG: protein kinase [candidate division KSB1 bacterium]|nr:protein kinase [candidate division KSB1 bacterium]MDZ7275287.1 protein kinase [candidate division KSB1 bacterium]MDZ7287455.1 protein kinase [candidate division KSB1 bacterium]MDZ7299569.1 protein kinase [candidate division KSB1 bacterium]MDZ7307321.1 protein kinase [candidate division KSB1 bacterium]